jgi:hypothetical protein
VLGGSFNASAALRRFDTFNAYFDLPSGFSLLCFFAIIASYDKTKSSRLAWNSSPVHSNE